MMEPYIEKLSMLPGYMQPGMKRWIEEGIEPGSFLMAVIANADVRTVFELADDTNRHCVFDYLIYLYNYAPSACWGCRENVQSWRAKLNSEGVYEPGGLARLRKDET